MIAGTFTFYNESDLLVFQIETLLTFCDILIIQGDNPTPEAEEIARSYKRKNLVYVIINRKKDNVLERDELGDRERLLVTARDLGASSTYHTDIDEIIRIQDIPKIKDLISTYQHDYIAQFSRYDLWYNAHNFRIPYNTDIYAGKELPMTRIPIKYEYLFPVSGASYGTRSIPNYHCQRVPYNYSGKRPEVIYFNHIYIIHFGYYRENLVKTKEAFYKSGKDFCGNVWGYDMQINDKEFIKQFGMGILDRKNDYE